MKQVVIYLMISCLFASIDVFAQRKGQYASPNHPLVQDWQFDGNSEDAPVIIDLMPYIFIRGGEQDSNVMAVVEMEEGLGCPSMFYFSYDEHYLYFDITRSCFVELPEEEKFITIPYRLEETKLILIIDGKNYAYKTR